MHTREHPPSHPRVYINIYVYKHAQACDLEASLRAFREAAVARLRGRAFAAAAAAFAARSGSAAVDEDSDEYSGDDSEDAK